MLLSRHSSYYPGVLERWHRSIDLCQYGSYDTESMSRCTADKSDLLDIQMLS
jgi:hypothetical protein